MKKLMIAATLTALCGCGNMTIIDTHWTFDKAEINLPSGPITVDVVSWHDFDNSDMIQLETKHRVYLTHSANVVFIKTLKGWK